MEGGASRHALSCTARCRSLEALRQQSCTVGPSMRASRLCSKSLLVPRLAYRPRRLHAGLPDKPRPHLHLCCGAAPAPTLQVEAAVVREAGLEDLDSLESIQDLSRPGGNWSRSEIKAEIVRERATVLVAETLVDAAAEAAVAAEATAVGQAHSGNGAAATPAAAAAAANNGTGRPAAAAPAAAAAATAPAADVRWAAAGMLVAWAVPPDELHVMELAVLPEHRRRGIARALLRALLDKHQHSASLATLEVRTSNEAAQALYRQLGFERVGLRRRYYKNGEDAVIMTLTMEPQHPGE